MAIVLSMIYVKHRYITKVHRTDAFCLSSLLSVPEHSMEDMMDYQCNSADNMLGFSGFSEVQMKALYSGTGSIPTHLLSGSYLNNAADMGSSALYDISDVENTYVSPNELSGLRFDCPYGNTGSRRHETSLSNYLMPKEEVAATEPYMFMECQHAESNAFPVQAVKTEEAYGFHTFLNHEASTSNPPRRSLIRAYRQRSRAAETESNRRAIIHEKMQALQELLPASSKGDQEAIVDNAIAHVKYLQLQLKELSRNKLGGESVSGPLSFLEGYGHYHAQEQMIREPLEEVIGTLMENNQTTALRLLETKGLHLMHMTSVDALRCSE
ncbi:hypothetical protein RND81_05G191700 [Saponaria officinalis]|uniref:BHLH domain-containing protein n=2 Tax=Saponaria officinalis TaxID=3572 RepID=A0AAW1KYE6_SAPOF